MLSTCFEGLRTKVQTNGSSLRTNNAIRKLLVGGISPLVLQ